MGTDNSKARKEAFNLLSGMQKRRVFTSPCKWQVWSPWQGSLFFKNCIFKTSSIKLTYSRVKGRKRRETGEENLPLHTSDIEESFDLMRGANIQLLRLKNHANMSMCKCPVFYLSFMSHKGFYGLQTTSSGCFVNWSFTNIILFIYVGSRLY